MSVRHRTTRDRLSGLGVVVVLCVLSTQAVGTVAPGLLNGKNTYEEFCAACHGYDGINMVPDVPSFSRGESLEQSDAVLLKSIQGGKGDIMPAWGEDLNEQEMLNVLQYIRTFAAGLEGGKETFEEFCAACHGYDGINVVPDVPSFARGESLQQSDAVLLKSIRAGKGDIMPAWSEDLSEQDMKNVLAYIRKFWLRN